jgi:hypothetical protein
MRVDDLARVPLSFPTYAGILARVAAVTARQLGLNLSWLGHQSESSLPRSFPVALPIPNTSNDPERPVPTGGIPC